MRFNPAYPMAFEAILGSGWNTGVGHTEDDILEFHMCRNTVGEPSSRLTTTGYKQHKDNEATYRIYARNTGQSMNTTSLDLNCSIDFLGTDTFNKNTITPNNIYSNSVIFTTGTAGGSVSVEHSSVMSPYGGYYDFDMLREHPSWLTSTFSGDGTTVTSSPSSWSDVFKYQGPILEPGFQPSQVPHPPIRITIPAGTLPLSSGTAVNMVFRVVLSASTGTLKKDMTDFFDYMTADKMPCIAVTSSPAPLYEQQRVHIQNVNTLDKIVELFIQVPGYNNNVDTVLFMYFDPSQPFNLDYVSIDSTSHVINHENSFTNNNLWGYSRFNPASHDSTYATLRYGNMYHPGGIIEVLRQGAGSLTPQDSTGWDYYAFHPLYLDNKNYRSVYLADNTACVDTNKLPGKSSGLKFDGTRFYMTLKDRYNWLGGAASVGYSGPYADMVDYCMQIGVYIPVTPSTLWSTIVCSDKKDNKVIPYLWEVQVRASPDNSGNFEIRVCMRSSGLGVDTHKVEYLSTITFPVDKYYHIGFIFTNSASTTISLVVDGAIIGTATDTIPWGVIPGAIGEGESGSHTSVGGHARSDWSMAGNSTYVACSIDYVVSFRGSYMGEDAFTPLQTLSFVSAMHNSDDLIISGATIIEDFSTSLNVKDNDTKNSIPVQGIQAPGENYMQSTTISSAPLIFQKIYEGGVSLSETPAIMTRALSTYHARLFVSMPAAVLKIRPVFFTKDGVKSYGALVTVSVLSIQNGESMYHCELEEFNTKGAYRMGILIESVDVGTVDVWAASN